MSKKLLLALTALLLVSSCDSPDYSSSNQENESSQVQESTSSNSQSQSNSSSETKVESRYKENYQFNYFKKINSETSEVIVDGLTHYTFNTTKSNDMETVIHTFEIDLSKLDIKAGTANNASYKFNYTKEVPYQCALDYERDTNKAVYATINADFFGGYCCNAFVKDGYIIKDSHNDMGSYDYTNTDADVPASAPLLFGVDYNGKAQIAPIVKYTGDIESASVKQKVIQSKLLYKINGNSKSMETSKTFAYTSSQITLTKGAHYLIVDNSGGPNNMNVESVNVASARITLKAQEGKACIYATASNTDAISYIDSFKVNDKISLNVSSEDGLWNNFETIIGGRHALIIDGKIPSTVANEFMNGAKPEDIPKSAVGLKSDGTVVLFAIESLYYGAKLAKDGDTHGINLVELAEFMYYYNIVDAVNFDGGGSTQVVTKNKIGDYGKVVVRSSDTGSSNPLSSRKVMNTLLVCEK